jgi:hypothetical protein
MQHRLCATRDKAMRTHAKHLPKRRTRCAHAALCLTLFVAGPGCNSQLEGPTPALAGAGQATTPIAPAIVCADQRTTLLDLRGQHLSPVAVNIPHDPALALPSLTLTRSAALDGSSTDAVNVVYAGDPTSRNNHEALRWLDTGHMQFQVDQARTIDGHTGRIPAGVYDARVTNPSGKQATSRGALAVVDKPTLTAADAALLCATKDAQKLTLTGTGFLRISDAHPTLRLGEQDIAIDVDELAQCSPLAQKDLDAELCTQAQITLEPRALGPGLYDLVLDNPEPAACHTEERAQLRVVPAPTLDSSPLEPICTRDKTRALVIRGEGFLEINGQPPTVTLGGQSVRVDALSDCENLELAGLSTRSCKQIQVPLRELMLGEAEVIVQVDNPAPANCAVSRRAETRAVLRAGSSGSGSCME